MRNETSKGLKPNLVNPSELGPTLVTTCPQGHAENAASGDAAVPHVGTIRHRDVPYNAATAETHWTGQCASDVVATHRGKRNDTGVAQGNVHSTTGVASALGQGTERRTSKSVSYGISVVSLCPPCNDNAIRTRLVARVLALPRPSMPG